MGIQNFEQTLASAMQLAKTGLPVFPCLPSKAPACHGGFRAGKTDQGEVRSMFLAHPAAPLIGVPTGRVSGLAVLDIDPRHGGHHWLAEHGPRLPVTRRHETRSGGVHILFQHQDTLRNSAGKIGPGVDVRAEGGYIIWWPSDGFSVANAGDLAPWPDWLVPPPSAPVRSPMVGNFELSTDKGNEARRYAMGALKRGIQRVATAPDGRRNDTLNTEAFALARFVPHSLSLQELANAMAAAGIAAGLDAIEIEKTVASALQAGVPA